MYAVKSFHHAVRQRASYLLLVATLLCSSGCSLKQRLNVQAEEGRPSAAQVQQVSIPYDAAQPRIALVVEPFTSSQVTTTFTNNQVQAVPVADQLAAQLTTALSNVGNFSLYDSRRAGSVKPKRGEKGPYLLRATLTEFNEVSDTASDSTEVSLGWIGAIAGIAGAITGKPGLLWTGVGIATANPSYEESSKITTGMVSFDIQVVESSSGRIVAAFDAAGKFKSEEVSNGVGLFGISNEKSKFASSAVGQALRAAMNDAVNKTVAALGISQ